MKTFLICHENARLDQIGLARWLSSFSTLTGILVLEEEPSRRWRRIRREIKRVGFVRFADVVAFRLYYRLRLARKDRQWEDRALEQFNDRYPQLASDIPVLHTHSPNSREAEDFIRQQQPDLMLARCKSLIAERVFSIPTTGTFVMHPGMCPEYRNAHGCFWALANDDLERVAMTLLKIDVGVDTGPIYGHYTYEFDAARESHVVVQARTVLENLSRVANKLIEIHAGKSKPIDTVGRQSSTWGQPWLSRYLKWKIKARKRQSEIVDKRGVLQEVNQ